MKYDIQDIQSAIAQFGSVSAAARELGMDRRGMQRRLRAAGVDGQRDGGGPRLPVSRAVISHRVDNGVVLAGGDRHGRPGLPRSAASAAFIRLARELAPAAIVLTGDMIDAATVSRHPEIGWENRPTVADEIEESQEFLAELEGAAPSLDWCLGNHDGRLETYLAEKAPEVRGLFGTHLKDHFPHWTPCWATDFNGQLRITHRWHSGVNASHNNVLKSGRSYATGHTHRLVLTPYDDLNGRRWGIETGTLAHQPRADWSGPQFENYTEMNPLNWQAGFPVFTFRDGRLLPPEFCYTLDEERGLTWFRGEVTEEDV